MTITDQPKYLAKRLSRKESFEQWTWKDWYTLEEVELAKFR